MGNCRNVTNTFSEERSERIFSSCYKRIMKKIKNYQVNL